MTVGPVEALVVVAIVVVVNQLEGDFLQPVVTGRAFSLHLLVIAVPAGTVLAGLTGAVLAVPVGASIWGAVRSSLLASRGGSGRSGTGPCQRVSGRCRGLTRAATDRCVHLDAGRDPGTVRVGEAMFTTAELLGADAGPARGRRSHELPPPAARLGADALPKAPKLAGLTEDQSSAVQVILKSPWRLDVLVGPAGTGKTTTLAALSAIAHRNGRPVIGLAPSAAAVHTLGEALGIATETTAKWLYEVCGPGAAKRSLVHDRAATDRVDPTLDPRTREAANQKMWQTRIEQAAWRFTMGQVVIVDEASLAGTPTLAILVQLAEQADATILLVGDHHQRRPWAPVGRSGCSPAADRPPSCTPCIASPTPGRPVPPWSCATANPRPWTPTRRTAPFTTATSTPSSTPPWTPPKPPPRRDGSPSCRPRTCAPCASSTARAHPRAILTGHVSLGGVVLRDGLTAGIGDRIVTRHNDRRLRTPDGHIRNGGLWNITAINPDGSLHVRPATPAIGGHR